MKTCRHNISPELCQYCVKEYVQCAKEYSQLDIQTTKQIVENATQSLVNKLGNELYKPVKHDGGKLQFSLIPVHPLRELAKLYTFGARKYAADNWRLGQGLTFTRCFDAMQRHAQAWLAGEDCDNCNAECKADCLEHTQCHHLASVAFYAFALMEYQMRKKEGLDDRYKE